VTAPGPASALVGLFLASSAWAAPPEHSHAVAFARLQPLGSEGSETRLELIAEAQRLRTSAESVLEILTGVAPVGHDALRELLGPAYLVHLFECGDDPACQARVLEPLRARGVVRTVVGHYRANGDARELVLALLDLRQGRYLSETTVATSLAALQTVAGWQAALQALFSLDGRIEVVTNVPAWTCALDGQPCGSLVAGVVEGVSPGEHVIEVSAEGYQPEARTVSVEPRERVRVAVALRPMPVVVEPRNGGRLVAPEFGSGEAAGVRPFGSLVLLAGADDENEGNSMDFVATRHPRSWHTSAFPLALLGIQAQSAPNAQGWRLRGRVSGTFETTLAFELYDAYIEVSQPSLGLRLNFGKQFAAVSLLDPSTGTLPNGFGNLVSDVVGVLAGWSIGRLVLEGFAGRPRPTMEVHADSAAPLPLFGGRIAWIDAGAPLFDGAPLTLSVSGAYGWQRVVSDVAGVQDPVTWLASVEGAVPLGTLASLRAELEAGEGANVFGGALRQEPIVDRTTRRALALASVGGWGEVAVRLGGDWHMHLVAGLDRVLTDFARTDANDGERLESSRIIAANVVFTPIESLEYGLQLDEIETVWHGPPREVVARWDVVFWARLSI
jgi:hypothetical protein